MRGSSAVAVRMEEPVRRQVQRKGGPIRHAADMEPLEGASEDLLRLQWRDPTDGYDFLPGRSVPMTPERRLMISVMDRAAADIVLGGQARGGAAEEVGESARRWVASEAVSWPFAFVRICDALGLEPQWVRRRIAIRVERELGGAGSRRGRGAHW